MSITWKNAYTGQPTGGADNTLYTCPANTSAKIQKCTVTNDTTSTITISFHKVPSGQAVADNYMVLNARAIGDSDEIHVHVLEGALLEAGDFISANPSASNQATVNLDVIENV